MKRLLWDTTLEPCEYPQIIKDIFFKESIKNRLTYTSWVGKISNRYKNDLDWWLTAPPSRNPFVSQIHKYLSSLGCTRWNKYCQRKNEMWKKLQKILDDIYGKFIYL